MSSSSELVGSADDGSALFRELLEDVGVASCVHCGGAAVHRYWRRPPKRADPGEPQHIGACCTVLCALRRVRQKFADR